MPCCRLTLPHESARNPGLGPKPERDINEGAQHPSRRSPPRRHTGTHRSGCEWLGSLCVRLLVRGSDRARSSEPDHPPEPRPERSGPSAETAGARDRSHPDRLPGSLWDKPPTPAQVAPSVAPQTVALTSSGQPSLLVTEQAGAEQQAAPRSPSTVPASPQPSAGQPITTELVTRNVPDTRRMASTTAEASDSKLIDINTASVDELNSLGARFGRAIVAGRPYTTIDELVSKRVLTRSTFSQIKDQITAN